MKEKLVNLPMGVITPSPHNPRRIVPNDPAIAELARSVEAHGLLQPVVCRPLGNGYELLAGRRRFEACKLIGRQTILATVHELDDQQALEVTVLENLQRQDLDPLSEARGVKMLLDNGHALVDVASHIGKSPAWVARRAKLTDLIPEIADAYQDPDGDWRFATAGHLELIARLPRERQAGFLRDGWMAKQPVQVMAQRIEEDEHLLKAAKWDLDDNTLEALPSRSKLSACAECQKRTDVQPDLFHEAGQDVAKSARCLDPACWALKVAAYIERRKAELTEKASGGVLLVHGQNADYSEKVAVKALETWQYDKAKKGSPGARLALVVSGHDAGKEVWVKADKAAASSCAQTKQPPIKDRRMAHVVKAVEKALLKAECPLTTLLAMCRLAAVIGTRDRRDFPCKDDWAALAAGSNSSDADVLSVLWGKVRPVILRRLRIYQVSDCGNVYDEARNVAELLGLDVSVLDAAAERALPSAAKGKGATLKGKGVKQ
jgi:ParB/RepB/Spo0J family partition protein